MHTLPLLPVKKAWHQISKGGFNSGRDRMRQRRERVFSGRVKGEEVDWGQDQQNLLGSIAETLPYI